MYVQFRIIISLGYREPVGFLKLLYSGVLDIQNVVHIQCIQLGEVGDKIALGKPHLFYKLIYYLLKFPTALFAYCNFFSFFVCD